MSGIITNLLRNITTTSLKSTARSPIIVSSARPLLQLAQSFCSTQPKERSAPFEVVDSEQDGLQSKKVIDAVNNQLAKNEQGRLFAVVQLSGKQFKITEGDIIVVEGYWPPECSDKISLDKVLLVGAQDFSLIGKPLVDPGLVKVQATVIEKCLSHTKTHFRKKRRKQYMRINFYRIQQTHLRINKIEICGEVNNPPDVSGNESAVF